MYLSPCTDWSDDYEAARVYVHEGTHACQWRAGLLGGSYLRTGPRWRDEVAALANESRLRVTIGLPVAGEWAEQEAHDLCDGRYGPVPRDCEPRARELLEYVGRWYRPETGTK